MVKTKVITIILIGAIFISVLFYGVKIFAGTLSCSVSTTCPSGVVIWKMSSTTNAHAELPSQSNYAQLVCCSGVAGLGNSCASSTVATALKLSGATNAHSEQNSQSNYANSACISVPSGGSVSVAYQASNCAGYDTTLASMTGATNAHVGDSNAYNTKICATASAGGATISCSANISSTDFGNLDSSIINTSISNASTTMTCDGAAGCVLYIKDAGSGANPGLWNSTSSALIASPNAAYSATTTLVAGTEGFGIQATTTALGSGGTLTISAKYFQTGNDVGGLALANSVLASSTAAITGREAVVTHKAAVSDLTPSGSYSDTITYSCVGN